MANVLSLVTYTQTNTRNYTHLCRAYTPYALPANQKDIDFEQTKLYTLDIYIVEYNNAISMRDEQMANEYENE